jgi:hypothetical protein
MDKVLRGLIPQIACCFLDDILIYGDSPPAILKNLECVLQKLKEAGLKLHPAKSHFAVTRVTFLGHIIDENAVHMHESRIEIMNKYPAPKTAKQLKSLVRGGFIFETICTEFQLNCSTVARIAKKGCKLEMDGAVSKGI